MRVAFSARGRVVTDLVALRAESERGQHTGKVTQPGRGIGTPGAPRIRQVQRRAGFFLRPTIWDVIPGAIRSAW